ncbi:MAG: carbohydrate kinase family protein, partial [Rudaea sp.]
VLEPAAANVASAREEYQNLLPLVTVFSPNTLEAQTITGALDPREMLEILLSWGAGVVAIRMGDRGSLVGAANGERWQVPPVVRTLVDVTGAGNAYCGGFLVGCGDGWSVRDAALRASVSASFAIEQFSIPMFDERLSEERDARLLQAAERIRRLDGEND